MGKHANKRKKTDPMVPVEGKADNGHLEGPTRMTLAEYWARDASPQVLQNRAMIYSLEIAMNEAIKNGTHEDIGPQMIPSHYFLDGVYMRSLFMPKGSRIVGMHHGVEHLVIMPYGSTTVFTDRGQEEFRGFNIFKSPAGEKRALQNHEDTVWITVHPTAAGTDLDAIKGDLILDESPELGLHMTRLRLPDA